MASVNEFYISEVEWTQSLFRRQNYFLNLEGNFIAITGGASGMGLALAKLLASKGAKLSIADTNETQVATATATLKSLTTAENIVSHQVDVQKTSQIEEWLQNIIITFGHLDGAANVAGNFDTQPHGEIFGEFFEDQDKDDWEKIIGVNLTGLAKCLKHELKPITSSGAIVNVSSFSGLRGGMVSAAYTASKHAVVGVTKGVAKQYGPKEMRVNVVAPGTVDTPMVDKAEAGIQNGVQVFKDMIAGYAIPRKAQPEEIAKVMMF